MGGLAEFERDLIRTRTGEGRDAQSGYSRQRRTKVRKGSQMHILAILGGAGLHIVGDIELCAAGVMTFRLRGRITDHYYEFSSRPAAAFELLPIPIGLLLAGLILGRWGYAGL